MSGVYDHESERRLARMIALCFALVAVGISLAQRDPEPESLPVRPLAVTVQVPGKQISPTISPDGARVVFATRSDAGDSRLWLWSRSSGSWSPVSNSREFEGRPAISPDGTRLAFWRVTDRQIELIDRNLANGDERILATFPIPQSFDAGALSGLSWAPDQNAIAFSRLDASGSVGINLVIPETRALRRVTSPWQGMIDVDPRFSPDGVSISYTRLASAGDSDVWIVDLDERVERRLTHDRRNVIGHAWEIGGEILVVSSNRLGRFELWTVSLDGQHPRWLGRRSNLTNPSIGHDGTMVAEEWSYDTNLWRIGGDGTPSRLVGSEEWDGSPRFSPNGRRLAFVTNRGGSWELWLANADGSAQNRLAGDIGALDAPAWSPDGSEIAVHSIGANGVDIFVVSLGKATWRRITADEADDVHPSWSPDGRWILFGSDRGGEWNVWRIPSKGGEPEQVTFRGGYRCEMADGGTVFFTRHGQRGLWSLDRRSETLVTDRIAAEDAANWRVSPDGISFLERMTDGSVFVRRMSFGGEIVGDARLDPVPIPHNASFDLSPEDDSIVWCRLDDEWSRVLVIPHERR